ncbi:hypothetical protein Q5W88_21800 [Shouchella clausii]|uniref:hypothetical protein n=1 Tax=Shouchella clausii TaxID=79880 RepID=UPI0026F45A07|nr:hypothetical protein [Shouchella clausii]MDO7285877.1 hypothetical protein [Shouchella clausii]MDO7305828.1 hypothetical protein [Shouchella clausii]
MSEFNKINSVISEDIKGVTLTSQDILKEKGYEVIDLNKAEITTYNPFDPFEAKVLKNNEVKTIIHDFVAADSVAELLADDSNYSIRLIMLDLLKKLAKKDELNESETVLLFTLSIDLKQQDYVRYSDVLVNAFKSVLKEVE